jgi:3-hydroxy-9,10-secoandrosta-1,3,5(10)-triene-9,17-dione monooxygenase reductase component
MSVSLKPRLVLWCLDDRSDRYDIFAAATHWSVNILAAEQQAISDRFSRSGAFEAGDLDMTERAGHAPTLNGVLASLSCRSHAHHTMGDHLVLVGEVEAYAMRDGSALGYLRGAYRQFPQEA